MWGWFFTVKEAGLIRAGADRPYESRPRPQHCGRWVPLGAQGHPVVNPKRTNLLLTMYDDIIALWILLKIKSAMDKAMHLNLLCSKS